MKKLQVYKPGLFVCISYLLLSTFNLFSQTPQGMNYQAVARNNAGVILISQAIGIRFTITDGGGGATLYRETHSTSTNQFGLFTLIVGSGTPVNGTFSAINWASVTPWLEVEMDPSGGTTYLNMGTSQLLSVPYSLFAASGNQGPQGLSGTNGATWFTGAGVPNGATGVVNDLYLNSANGDYYKKTGASTWTLQANLTGPTGATGLLSSGSAAGNTPYWNGTSWILNSSNLFNNGANIGIGTTSPGAKLEVNGQVKITGGTPGTNKILTSDAAGLATWQTPASGMGGSGTLNYVSKFTAANAVGNSQIFDNGTNVGIGTNTPEVTASVHVNSGTSTTNGFLVSGTLSAISTVPDLGAGSRLQFYPGKSAFRAGYVGGSEWDDVNVGQNSVAMGVGTTASGFYSTAFGVNTEASSDVSTVMGYSSVASGIHSIAMGAGALASGHTATAIGASTTANGNYSMAMGMSTIANGESSIAIGALSNANGIRSYAIGTYVSATGDNSTAMGNYVSTSGFNGAYALGDNSTTTIMPSFVDNGYRARFAGGYRLLTNSAATIGLVCVASGNSWSAISDERMKENFIAVDGETFLQKISVMPLTTWNYKGQDVKTLRHYGPMAQDFYTAFGHDKLGEIGCDTLINQQDFLGVNLIAIQALGKRTEELNKQIEQLQSENTRLNSTIEHFEKENGNLKADINDIKSELQEMKMLIQLKAEAKN